MACRGKIAKIARMEMLTMPDIALRYAALTRGEVDYLEYAPVDLIRGCAAIAISPSPRRVGGRT